MMKLYVNKSMKFGEIVPKVLKTLRSPVGRMTSHPDVNSQSAARLGHVRKMKFSITIFFIEEFFEGESGIRNLKRTSL